MTTEALVQASSANPTPHATGILPREVTAWVLARVAEDHEAVFTLELDERFWRLRRVHGAMASMMESKLLGAASAGDLAAALVRWATGAGLVARATSEAGGFRVALSRQAD